MWWLRILDWLTTFLIHLSDLDSHIYAIHLQNIGVAYADARAGIIGKDGEFIHWANLDQVRIGNGKNAPSAILVYYENFKFAQDLAVNSIAKNRDHSIEVDSMAKRGVEPTEFNIVTAGSHLLNIDKKIRLETQHWFSYSRRYP